MYCLIVSRKKISFEFTAGADLVFSNNLTTPVIIDFKKVILFFFLLSIMFSEYFVLVLSLEVINKFVVYSNPLPFLTGCSSDN